jgi:hypothetical protein
LNYKDVFDVAITNILYQRGTFEFLESRTSIDGGGFGCGGGFGNGWRGVRREREEVADTHRILLL